MSEAPHASVLLAEVIEALSPVAGRRIVDATFGAGGYSRALLEGGAEVVAFDRDPGAVRFAEPLSAAFPGRFRLIQRCFSELEAGPVTVSPSTSACRPCNWIRPSEASPSCATDRWTCAWATTARPRLTS
jgi:hypothetical protein